MRWACEAPFTQPQLPFQPAGLGLRPDCWALYTTVACMGAAPGSQGLCRKGFWLQVSTCAEMCFLSGELSAFLPLRSGCSFLCVGSGARKDQMRVSGAAVEDTRPLEVEPPSRGPEYTQGLRPGIHSAVQPPKQAASRPDGAERPGSSSGPYPLRHSKALTHSPQRKRRLGTRR